MKCFEVTKCAAKVRESCFVWNNFQTNPAELENVKCWILKGGCNDGNEEQLAKCRQCAYYRQMNHESGIAFKSQTDYAIIACEGSFNNERNKALKKVWQTIKGHGKTSVLLDLSRIDTIYSSGLATIIDIQKETKSAGGALVVVCPQEHIKKLLDLAKLSRIVAIANSMREAYDVFVAHKEHREKKAAQASETLRVQPQPHQLQKERPACYVYWKNKNPQNATTCDECSKKIRPTPLPCWIVDGVIEGISFQYVNEDCVCCRYYEEFGAGASFA